MAAEGSGRDGDSGPGPQSDRDSRWQSSLHDASPYLTIGIQLAGTMLVYVVGGYLIDRWMDTEPVFLIVGAIVGMIAFFVQIVRLAKDLSDKDRAKKAGKKDHAADDGSIHS